jgi:hypothetical protein
MATHVIHEHDHTAEDGGSGAVVGIVLLVLFVLVLLYFFGSGAFRGFVGGGTNIQIPDKVNVNVQGPGK